MLSMFSSGLGFLCAAIGTCPSLAHTAANGLRSGNTLRSLPRTSCATSALHRKPRTDARRGQRPPRQRSPMGWRARTQPTGQSTPLRSPRTSGSERSGRNPPRPIASAERLGQACRVPQPPLVIGVIDDHPHPLADPRSGLRSASDRRSISPAGRQKIRKSDGCACGWITCSAVRTKW
jgi:hypothetical protein